MIEFNKKFFFRKVKFILFLFCVGVFVSLTNCAVKSGIYYTVKEGDTLNSISSKYNIPIKSIYRTNDAETLKELKSGKKIFLPGVLKLKKEASSKKVTITQKNEKVKINEKKKSANLTRNTQNTQNEENAEKRDIKFDNELNLIFPLTAGKVIGTFGGDKEYVNRGIDIESVGGNKDVIAADDGKVLFSGTIEGYGKVIFLKHKFNYTTVYANNDENLVKENDFVKKGAVIARVGYSHKYNKNILHFEIRKINANNKIEIIDPLKYLKESR